MSQEFTVSKTKICGTLEFVFQNSSPIDLDIYYESRDSSNKVLYFSKVCHISKNSKLYIYPKGEIKPGGILYAKRPTDDMGTFAFQPYALKWMDHTIIWGEITIDFFTTKDIYSPRQDILSLVFTNLALFGYDIWYIPQMENPAISGVKKREYLGRLQPYYPGRDKIAYTLRTTNASKYFQLGTWIEFRMQNSEKSQYIQLSHPATTDIWIGIVRGRTELGE